MAESEGRGHQNQEWLAGGVEGVAPCCGRRRARNDGPFGTADYSLSGKILTDLSDVSQPLGTPWHQNLVIYFRADPSPLQPGLLCPLGPCRETRLTGSSSTALPGVCLQAGALKAFKVTFPAPQRKFSGLASMHHLISKNQNCESGLHRFMGTSVRAAGPSC